MQIVFRGRLKSGTISDKATVTINNASVTWSGKDVSEVQALLLEVMKDSEFDVYDTNAPWSTLPDILNGSRLWSVIEEAGKGSISIRVKGGPGSGYHGHAGRPGLEGGAIPKGGSRRVYGTGKRTQSFPKGKKIPPVPKLTQGRVSGVPKHVKGDTSGANAYRQWKSNAGTVSEVDDAKMRSWFGDRAKAMEFNLDIPTVVPGQRDEEEGEPEKKKEPEKKDEAPKKGKGKKKGKAPAKKKAPKGKAPAKPKKAKIVKKKGITDAERAKILKAVGVKPEVYKALREVEKSLKAGDMPSMSSILKLKMAGFLTLEFAKNLDFTDKDAILKGAKPTPGDIAKIRLLPFGQSLLKSVERGDAITAQRILDRVEAKKKSISIRVRGGPGSGHHGQVALAQSVFEGDL